MHTWDWRGCEGFLYLSCSLLEAFPHGFFTRHFHPHAPHDLTSALQPAAAAYRVKQVHGNVVVTPSEIGESGLGQEDKEDKEAILATSFQPRTPHPSPLAEADGLLTEQPLQAVWVASADCTPVLIADRHTGQVAAVHAGWRGTAIAGNVYQVSQQVAAEVGASIISTEATAEILDLLAEIPDSPLSPDSHPERVRLDIRRVIALQLEQLGISAEQVAIAPHCTYQEPERFFSYRRDKQKKVQWSGIISQ